MQAVVDNVKNLIRAKGLKQKFVAEKMGLSPQEFSNILTGRKKFTTEYVVPVCNALNITANELFGIKSQIEVRKEHNHDKT